MDPFLKVFFTIDKDASGKITINELQDYVKENNMEETMVTDWQRLFDPDGVGHITLDKFCETLGIAPADAELQRTQMSEQGAAAPPPPTPPSAPPMTNGIEYLFADVSDHIKEEIASNLTELLNSVESKEEVSVAMKQLLDGKYGRSWVVMLTADSFWLKATPVAESTCLFRTKDVSCLIWKTYEGDLTEAT